MHLRQQLILNSPHTSGHKAEASERSIHWGSLSRMVSALTEGLAIEKAQ